MVVVHIEWNPAALHLLTPDPPPFTGTIHLSRLIHAMRDCFVWQFEVNTDCGSRDYL